MECDTAGVNVNDRKFEKNIRNGKPRFLPGLSVSYEGGDSEFINYLK